MWWSQKFESLNLTAGLWKLENFEVWILSFEFWILNFVDFWWYALEANLFCQADSHSLTHGHCCLCLLGTFHKCFGSIKYQCKQERRQHGSYISILPNTRNIANARDISGWGLTWQDQYSGRIRARGGVTWALYIMRHKKGGGFHADEDNLKVFKQFTLMQKVISWKLHATAWVNLRGWRDLWKLPQIWQIWTIQWMILTTQAHLCTSKLS